MDYKISATGEISIKNNIRGCRKSVKRRATAPLDSDSGSSHVAFVFKNFYPEKC